ncbi:hypothetical protein GQ54DRAFT_298712 [Martensiomyces pterosporus]|nr:hypothetical protein GQ54DRAFT_298712 [Martensiomyces pterosporus]
MATFKSLSAGLDWSTGLPAAGTTTLISGGLESEGSVLIPHFLSGSLDQQVPVILLSFTQTYNHYMHIMRKMGINLTKHKIQFVNALTQAPLSALPSATRPHYTLSEWPEFFAWLAQQPPSVLIIDGLCSLLDQGRTVDEAVWFFGACQRITEEKREGGARLVANVFLDEFTELLVRSVVRKAHYFFNFEALSSGASTDVSGQLTVVPGHLNCQLRSEKQFKPVLLHYKVTDTTVQFFSPGQARTVL